MTLDDCRRFYAKEIQCVANLTSPAVVEALATIPREEFMGPSPWQIVSPELLPLVSMGLRESSYVTTNDPQDLYHNVLVALDTSRQLNNGQPSALAFWINALDLKSNEYVFHAGCGVGYYTAIMAEIVGDHGKVFAAEIDESLAARAKENLAAFRQVNVHAGDAALADPGECDAMLINAGVTHPHLPWLNRLRDGGRMVLPITFTVPGATTGPGVMVKIIRQRELFHASVISMVAIYSCTGVRDTQLEPLLKKALVSNKLLKLKSVRLDSHDQSDSCIVHAEKFCLSIDQAIT